MPHYTRNIKESLFKKKKKKTIFLKKKNEELKGEKNIPK